MATWLSKWMEEGKPALGGTMSGVYAVASQFNIDTTAAIGDIVELCPIEANAKLLAVQFLADPVLGTTGIADLVLIPKDGSPNVTLISPLNSGLTGTFGIIVPKEGTLALVLSVAPLAAGTIPFAIEYTYD